MFSMLHYTEEVSIIENTDDYVTEPVETVYAD